MNALIDQRCYHHPTREAVVRCPECRRFFCRECVTEHRGRMVCAGCIARETVAAGDIGQVSALWLAASVGGLLLAWLIFYNLGVMLARITPDFLQ